MSSLYPENTSYQGQNQLAIPPSSFKTRLKSLNERVTASVNKKKASSPASSFVPVDTRLIPPSQRFSSLYGIQSPELNKPLGASTGPMSLTDYNSQNPDMALEIMPQSQDPNVVVPSDQTKIAQWPTGLSDGEYLTDPAQPGGLVKNLYPSSPREKQILLGGLPPEYFQIEHIVPRWAGGADTLANKQVMSTEDHQKKTNLQAVPYTLLYYSNIANKPQEQLSPSDKLALSRMDQNTLNYFKDPNTRMTVPKARAMAMDWKNRSAADVPRADENTGLIPVDKALHIADQWANPKVGFKEWKQEIPGAFDTIGSAIEKRGREVFSGIPVAGPAAWGALKGMANEVTLGYAKKLLPKTFGEVKYSDVLSPREQFNALFLAQDLAKKRDAAKASGDKTGAAKFEAQRQHVQNIMKNPSLLRNAEDEETEKVNQTSSKIGEAIGGIIGSGMAYSKAAGVMTAPLKVAKGFVAATKKAPLIGRLLGGAAKTATTAEEAAIAAKNAAAIGSETAQVVSKTIGPVSKEMIPTIKYAIKGNKILVDSKLAAKSMSSSLLKNVVKTVGRDIGLQQVFSELHQQDDRSLNAMVNRGFYNALYGVTLGTAKHDLKGYARVGAGALGISLMQTKDLEESLVNAGTMLAMHGVFHGQARPGEKIADLQKKQIELLGNLEHTGNYAAEDLLSRYGVTKSPGSLETYTARKYSQDEIITMRGEALKKLYDLADNQVSLGPDGKPYKTGWEPEDIQQEVMRINVALRQLEKGNMSTAARAKADQEDIRSYVKAMSEKEASRDTAPSRIAEDLLTDNQKYVFSPKGTKHEVDTTIVGADAPSGVTAVTGVAGGISPWKAENIRQFQEHINNGTAGERLVLVSHPEVEPHIKSAQSRYDPEAVKRGEKYVDPNPHNVISVNGVVRRPDGSLELLPLGYMPSGHKMNDMNNKPWVQPDGGKEVFNLDKDQLATYMTKKGLKVGYADLDTIQLETANSGQPFVKFRVTPENMAMALKDFQGSAGVTPSRTSNRIVAQAVQAKTTGEAAVAVKEVAKTMEIEPAGELLTKAMPEETRSPQSEQMIKMSNRVVDGISSAKTPEDLVNFFKTEFKMDIDPQKAAEWMNQKESLTTRSFFEEIRSMAINGDPMALLYYKSTIEPFLESGDFKSTPAYKTILEAPLLGTPKPAQPEMDYPNQKMMSPEEEARMESVLGRPSAEQNAPRTNELAPESSQTNVAVKTAPEAKTTPESPVLEPKPQRKTFKRMAKEAPIEKTPSPTEGQSGDTPLQAVERAEVPTPSGEATVAERQPGAWSQFVDGVHKGTAELIERKLATLERGTPEFKALGKLRKTFSEQPIREKMRTMAKENTQGGETNIPKAYAEFVEYYSKRLRDVGLPDAMANKGNRDEMFRLFHRTVESKPQFKLSVSKNGSKVVQAADEPRSFMDDQIDVLKKDLGLSDDSLVVAHAIPEGKMTHEDIDRAFVENGFVPIGATGNAKKSLFAVKYDETLAKRYDEALASGDTRYDSKLDTGKLTDKKDKFLRVFMVDGLGLDPHSSAGDVLKRYKILNSHETKNAHRDPDGNIPTYHYVVAESPKLGDMAGMLDMAALDKGSHYHSDKATYAKALAALKERGIFDGGMYMTQEGGMEMMKSNGLRGKQRSAKPTIVSRTENGMIMQKGNVQILDKTSQAMMEKMFGVKMDKYTVLTFKDNVKIGGKALKPLEGTPYSYYDAPATDMRIQYHNPHEARSSLSLSILAKFGDDPKIFSDISKLYGKQLEQWKGFNSEIQTAKSADEVKTIFEKYKNFDLNVDGFQDKYIQAMKNGAGPRALNRILTTKSLSILQKKILSGDFFPGDHLVLAQDVGLFSEPGGKQRFLKTNEIGMTQEKWESLGKPEYVMAARFPVSRTTALVKAKVLVAPKGVNLGDDMLAMSHHDVFVRMEGDYDRDAVSIYKIGGEDGVPESLVNAIEKRRGEDGDMLLAGLSKFAPKPLTYKNTKDAAGMAILGGEEVGKTAAVVRVANDFLNSKIEVKVTNQNGKRSVEFISNGKRIGDAIKIKPGEETGSLKPTWTADEEFTGATLLQKAVDSLKSGDLKLALDENGMPDTSFIILSKMFKTKDQEIIKAIQNFAFRLQAPYTIGNRNRPFENTEDFNLQLQKYTDTVDAIREAGGDVGIPGKLLMGLKGTEPVRGMTDYESIKSDDAAAKSVREAAEQSGRAGELKGLRKSSKKVSEFIEFANNARVQSVIDKQKFKNVDPNDSEAMDAIKRLSDHRKDVIERWDAMKDTMTDAERDAVRYWAMTDAEANIYNGIVSNTDEATVRKALKLPSKQEVNTLHGLDYRDRRKWAGKVWRYDEIINSAEDDLAKAFYKGLEEWQMSDDQMKVVTAKITQEVEPRIARIMEDDKKVKTHGDLLTTGLQNLRKAIDGKSDDGIARAYSNLLQVIKTANKK